MPTDYVYSTNFSNFSRVDRRAPICRANTGVTGAFDRAVTAYLSLLEFGDHLQGEVHSGSLAAHVWREDRLFAVLNDGVHGVLQARSVLAEAQVAEHERRGKEGRRGICDPLAREILLHVTSTLLKESDAVADVHARGQSRASHQTSRNIRKEVAVQVGCHNHIIPAVCGVCEYLELCVRICTSQKLYPPQMHTFRILLFWGGCHVHACSVHNRLSFCVNHVGFSIQLSEGSSGKDSVHEYLVWPPMNTNFKPISTC